MASSSSIFPQLTSWRFTAERIPQASAVEEALAKSPFCPLGATQEKTQGWVAPRGTEVGALLEAVAGQWIMRLRISVKSVPGSAMRKAVDKRCREIEQETGRVPGKKERREIKEEVRLELLPRAFARDSDVTVWIDRQAGFVHVNVGAGAAGDAVATQIIKDLSDCFGALSLYPLMTEDSPVSRMTHWLQEHRAPGTFEINRDVELKSSDESKATVKYAHHSLAVDTVQEHLRHGLLPVKLAMSWNGAVAFTLGAVGALTKIEMLDAGEASPKDSGEDWFDSAVALETGALSALLPELHAALGGLSALDGPDI